LRGTSQNMADNSFRAPLMVDDDGGYITKAQLKFFMNRRRGFDKIQSLDTDFLLYMGYCKTYNYLWDCSKNRLDVLMYWDNIKNTIAFSFPKTGRIAETISKWKDG